jgi:hypothetical protein
MDDRPNGLLAWQWAHYRTGHRDRANLVLHAATVPLFMIGTCAIAVAPLAHAWLGVVGLVAMVGAIAAQGRGHRREETRPIPFRSAVDVVLRLFVEQWVTFPRFVLSGGFAAAWRHTG